jgi:hypothetical protein
MLIYAMRIFDRFNQLPVSLAILCDSNSTWRPKDHLLTSPGSSLEFNFTTIKLLDYREQWEGLKSNPNPFAVVVMAHLKAQETKNKAQERKNWKFQLVRGLYDRSYNRSQILDLFRFIDFVIVLPEGLSDSFWNDLKTYEEERKMTYVTSVEKIGFKRGEQEGRETAQKEIALKMIGEQVPLETIARLTELSIEQIQELQSQQG